MKQILQDMANGGTTVTKAPVPQCSKGHLLISTTTSLISAGIQKGTFSGAFFLFVFLNPYL